MLRERLRSLILVSVVVTAASCTSEPPPEATPTTDRITTVVEPTTAAASEAEVCDEIRTLWALAEGADPGEGAQRAIEAVEFANEGVNLELARSAGIFGKWVPDRALAPSDSNLLHLMPPTLIEEVAVINRVWNAAERPTGIPEDRALLLLTCLDEFCGFPEDFELVPTPSTSTTTESSTTSTTTVSPPSSDSANVQFEGPEDLLERFAELWGAEDFRAMEAIATPQVVDEARRWNADEVSVLWSFDCVAGSLGIGGCTLLVYPLEPPALIFFVGYELKLTTGDRVTELVFEGDAG